MKRGTDLYFVVYLKCTSSGDILRCYVKILSLCVNYLETSVFYSDVLFGCFIRMFYSDDFSDV